MATPGGSAAGDARRGAQTDVVEWPTVALILACYGIWALALLWLWPLAPVPAFLLAVAVLTLHSSLTHEVLHGHPFPDQRVNAATMALPLTLLIPYARFRDLHLAHHRDSDLTDPYDDPESNYLDPAVWAALPAWKKRLFAANNTLAGRILLGPAIGQAVFMADEWRLIGAGDRAVRRAWGTHMAGAAVVLALVALSSMPVWAYLAAVYLAMGVLRIRTFLEHRAHERSRARTVIIEDRGPLAFLLLNNNLHVVHHMHPRAPWYRLPAMYRAGRERYLAANEGYLYRSYAEVFRRHFLRAKDPVPHPLWPGER